MSLVACDSVVSLLDETWIETDKCRDREGSLIKFDPSMVELAGRGQGKKTHLERPSLGLCLRPASTAFALLLDLIVVLPKPLFCEGWELIKEPEGFVALEVMLAAEAISCRLGQGAGNVTQLARTSRIDRAGQSNRVLMDCRLFFFRGKNG